MIFDDTQIILPTLLVSLSTILEGFANVWITQVRILLEECHPGLEELATPDAGKQMSVDLLRSYITCLLDRILDQLTDRPSPHHPRCTDAALAESWPLHSMSVLHSISMTLRCLHLSTTNSPLRRRFSPKKPTSCSGLLRTRLTITASFSRPRMNDN